MSICGFIPLYKPTGMSSQQAVSRVKRLSGVKKVGHTGTLDPAAQGLLLVALGRATRLAEYFLAGDKGYQAEIYFGKATDTGDREGSTTHRLEQFDFSPAEVNAVLARFQGEIDQVPPAASALKINGQRAYKLFRQGRAPEMPVRKVCIKSICPRFLDSHISQVNPCLSIDVVCSKGTYIRSLAMDIGSALGCPAHLSALVRTSLGHITLDQAASFVQLEEGIEPWLLSPAVAVHKLPKIQLDSKSAEAFCHGRKLDMPGPRGDIAVFFGSTLLGTAQGTGGTIKPVKVIQE